MSLDVNIGMGMHICAHHMPHKDADPDLTLDWNFLHGDGGTLATSVMRGPVPVLTRAASGEYYDADGLIQKATTSVPRWDHFPATGVRRGLLLEPTRTNFCIRSRNFENVAWAKTNTTVDYNAMFAPDGAITADLMIENDDTNQFHRVWQSAIAADPKGPVCFSVYVKAAGRDILNIDLTGHGDPNDGVDAYFDLGTGLVGTKTNSGQGLGVDAGMLALPNGWFRCWVSGTRLDTPGTQSQVLLYSAVDTEDITYDGDGSSGLYLWGAQAEEALTPSSHIVTSGGPVTRQEDILSTTDAGWFSQTAGTFIVQFSRPGYTALDHLVSIQVDGVANSGIELQSLTEALSCRVDYNRASGQDTLDTGLVPVRDQVHKLGFAYAADNLASAGDGVLGATDSDTGGEGPTAGCDIFNIGFGEGQAQVEPLHIQRVTYCQRREYNADVVGLTT